MVLVIAGTRPEIIKLAPVVHELKRRQVDYELLLSSQHYNDCLTKFFLMDLNLTTPSELSVMNEPDPANQVATLLRRSVSMLGVGDESVIVQGDTNTALAAALATRKLSRYLYHVEAGLRSRDWNQPEEHNRKIIDHIADMNFAPTNVALGHLIQEGIDTSMFVTGNTVVDAVKMVEDKIPDNMFSDKEFVYLTLHRAELVDDRGRFKYMLQALSKTDKHFVWPMHPRTRMRIKQFNLNQYLRKKRYTIIEPVDYLHSLSLLKHCECVATDSGGLVEEATVLKKPCIILRQYNDRPEAVMAKHAFVPGWAIDQIVKTFEMYEDWYHPYVDNPYGDGNAAKMIVDKIRETRW